MRDTRRILQVMVSYLHLSSLSIAKKEERKYSTEKAIGKGDGGMEEIIKVEHLKKYFQRIKAVDDISFAVEKGELFGFLGVNGAGKSTTIRMLCTLSAPTEGRVTVEGLELGRDNEEIKRRIGVVYQNNCLDNLLTVKENLAIRGALYEGDKRKLRKNLDTVCEVLELGEVLKQPFGKLSGGQQRRCELARALLHTPDILFLDEPTTGLDPSARRSVWSIIHTLQKEMKMTVFLTTHYMEEAAKADHIAMIDRGHLVQYGTPFSLKERFAKDKLRLFPREGAVQKILMDLDRLQIRYQQKEGLITVPIASTMSALPIVENYQGMLLGFEVVQGTMDDVFLHAAGEEAAYA